MSGEGVRPSGAEAHEGGSVSARTPVEVGGANFPCPASCMDMAIQTEAPAGGERTRALLVEIAGGRRAVQLRGQVAAAKRGASREQIEEAFQEACLRAGRGGRGQSMGEGYKWLLPTTDPPGDDAREPL